MKRRTFLKTAASAPALAILSAKSNTPVTAAEKTAPNSAAENQILKKIMALKKGIAICWLGNAGWLIRSANCVAAFDLSLDIPTRLAESPIPTEKIAPLLDVHFITHIHHDHFDDTTCKILTEKSNCKFVLPASCLQKAEKIGIPKNRIRLATPREPFDIAGIHVEPFRALHGRQNFTVAQYANFEDCGYLLTIAGRKFFQPGDTVLLQEHFDLTDTNVLFISPTVHNTHIDRSAILINEIEPDYIFPQHFGTFAYNEENFYWAKGYPDELKKALPKPMQKRYHKPQQGQVFIIQ